MWWVLEAGGSVAAFELSKRGFNVLVVESGPYATADSFDQGEADHDEQAL